MKHLISHAFMDHPQEIVSQSIKNCHVLGMHSIMFESFGKKIRMFYTDCQHELWKNTPDTFEQGLSIGFHPHHCNISLVPVIGEILNWSVEEIKNGTLYSDMYRFQSHILSGKGGFEKIASGVRLETSKLLKLGKGNSVYMPARELHSVGVEKGAQVAWMVLEGTENPDHNERCYSNKDLCKWSPQGLYTPYESIEEIREDLFQLGII